MSGVSCVGGRLGHDSHVMSVRLYKLEAGGVPNSSSSRVAELAQISSELYWCTKGQCFEEVDLQNWA